MSLFSERGARIVSRHIHQGCGEPVTTYSSEVGRDADGFDRARGSKERQRLRLTSGIACVSGVFCAELSNGIDCTYVAQSFGKVKAAAGGRLRPESDECTRERVKMILLVDDDDLDLLDAVVP